MTPVPANVPKFCHAAVLREFNRPLSIEAVPVPRQLEPGALLVKTECCTICGTDVHLVRGKLNRPVNLPVIVGHEMTGRVVAVGDGAEEDSMGHPVRIGDRIVWTRTNCGQCYTCTVVQQPTLCPDARAYMYETMTRPPHLLGGLSEYIYVYPDSGRVVVPDSVPSPLASMASCAFRSVVHAFFEMGTLRPTDTVVVQGTGPLGLLAVGMARLMGAHRVIAIGAPDDRLNLALEFGAEVTLSVKSDSRDDRLEAVLQCTEGRGADVVMDFAGQPDAFLEGLKLVRRGGTYLVVGQLGREEVSFRPSEIVHRNLRIVGSLAGGATDYNHALELIDKHQHSIPFNKLVSKRYGLKDAEKAILAMETQSEIKPIISFETI